MPRLVIFNKRTGHLSRILDCPDDMVSVQASDSEIAFADESATADTHYLDGETLTAYTPEQVADKAAKPAYQSRWSDVSLSWVDLRSLDGSRGATWERIKSSRNDALVAPLTTVYGVFDADDGSQKNITDAISMLQTLSDAGYPQTIEYTLYDNTVVTLSTAQMVEVGLALGQRTQQIYATSRTLRTAIDAATTISEIESITWPT